MKRDGATPRLRTETTSMNLVLTGVETERLVRALGTISSDRLHGHAWHIALAGAVGWLLRAPTVVIDEAADAVRMVGEATGALLADWAEHYGGRGVGGPPTGVWAHAARAASAHGQSCDLVGMTAHAPHDDIRLSVVCQTHQGVDADATERCATVLRLLFPAFDAAVERRSADDHSADDRAAPAPSAAAPDPTSNVDDAVATLHRRYRLTRRELDVTRLLLTGKSNDEVALTLGISAHTARHHTERIFTKVDVRSRAALWPVAFDGAVGSHARAD